MVRGELTDGKEDLETGVLLLEVDDSLVETFLPILGVVRSVEGGQLMLFHPPEREDDVRAERRVDVLRNKLSIALTVLRPVGEVAYDFLVVRGRLCTCDKTKKNYQCSFKYSQISIRQICRNILHVIKWQRSLIEKTPVTVVNFYELISSDVAQFYRSSAGVLFIIVGHPGDFELRSLYTINDPTA